MPMEGYISLINCILFDAGSGNYEVEEEEASKENKSPFYISNVTEKGYYQVKDHAVSEGDRNQPKLIQDLAKEGKYTSVVDWLVEDQEGDIEEGQSCSINSYVTVMLFNFHMIFLCLY